MCEKYFKLFVYLTLGLILFGACKPNIPAPAVTISTNVANNVVTFSLATTNSTAYKWRFGDGDSAIVYTSAPLNHSYPKDGTTYTATLLTLGPGGQATATATVTIPTMTQLDMLTGGSFFANGKAWRISSSSGVISATPNLDMTVVSSFPAGFFESIQMSQVYTDQYIFKNDGNYVIAPKGGGILAGLAFCTVNNIQNVQPLAAASLGLTYAMSTIPTGLNFALNFGKILTIAATVDGISSTNVTYNNVNTLSFSSHGFVGLMDFMSECIVQQLTPTRMTIAFFVSNLSPQDLQIGKTNNILIVTFEAVP